MFSELKGKEIPQPYAKGSLGRGLLLIKRLMTNYNIVLVLKVSLKRDYTEHHFLDADVIFLPLEDISASRTASH